jgi:hypothetical protein
MTERCILCANGKDMPDGEWCRACGRVGLATGLRAAVIKARGRNEPPSVPVAFDGDPTSRGDAVAREVREWYERNRESWWNRLTSSAARKGIVADDFMLGLINAVHEAERAFACHGKPMADQIALAAARHSVSYVVVPPGRQP